MKIKTYSKAKILATAILAIAFTVGKTFAQINLVPNPSFEQYTICPTSDNQIQYAAPWFNPTLGTSDYYNACFTGGGFNMDVPDNWIGYQNARTGMGYSGIAVFPAQNPPSYREYIEVKLSDSLQSGKKYYVSFYVSLADSVRYATDDIGAYFSNDSIFSNSDINLLYTPQFSNPDGNMLTNKTDWVQVFGEFIAQGGEQFMTIGNFKDDLNTDTIFVGGGDSNYFLTTIYYYIDDVCISDNPDTCNVQTSIGEHSLQNAIILYPNPTKDNVNIKLPITNGNIPLMKIYDLLGNVKAHYFLQQSNNSIKLPNLRAGIYIVEFQLSDKTLKQKLVITN